MTKTGNGFQPSLNGKASSELLWEVERTVDFVRKIKLGDLVQTSLLRYKVTKLSDAILPVVSGQLVAVFYLDGWREPFNERHRFEELHIGCGNWEMVKA